MLNNLTTLKNIKTRSVSPENFTGEKGKGGMSTTGAAASCARDLGAGWKISPYIVLAGKSTAVLADIAAMGAIKHVWLTTDTDKSRTLILRIYYEGSSVPSVQTPLFDFFASAIYKPYTPLQSLPVCVNPQRSFNCYWEMPFKTGCKITLENMDDKDVTVYYQIDYEEKEIPKNSAYFHAQFRRVNPLPYKEVYTILDGITGKGHYVGTYMLWGSNNNGWWGEGEIKFYLDGDKAFPTICGTGTEDYFCGAYCFCDDEGRYQEYSTPYCGLSKALCGDGSFQSQQRFSLYRWHICDPIYFDKDIRVTMQALGWRSGGRYLPLQDDISSVAFWYQDSICETFPPFPDFDTLEII